MTNNVHEIISAERSVKAGRQSTDRSDLPERELSPFSLSLIKNIISEGKSWKCRDTINQIGDMHEDVIRAINSLADALNSPTKRVQYEMSSEDACLMQTLNRIQWDLDKIYRFVREASEIYQDNLRELIDVCENRITFEGGKNA